MCAVADLNKLKSDRIHDPVKHIKYAHSDSEITALAKTFFVLYDGLLPTKVVIIDDLLNIFVWLGNPLADPELFSIRNFYITGKEENLRPI